MKDADAFVIDAYEFTDEVQGYSACAYAVAANKPQGGGSVIVDEAV